MKKDARDRELPLQDHLRELQRRVMVSLITLALFTALSFTFARHIFRLLLVPAPGITPIYTELTELFGTYTKISLLSGLALSFPVILYQTVMFLAPGLTSREKRYLYLLAPGVLLCFAGGVLFGYFVLLPPAIHFLLTFGSDIATPMIRIGSYVNLVVTLLFWLGVTFETPLVMFFLAKIRLLSPRALARQRRLAIMGAFILGAAITPTFDPVNQSLAAIPLILLYELGIWLAKIAYPREKKSSETEAETSPNP